MPDTVNARSLRGLHLGVLHRTSNEAFVDYPVDVRMTRGELESLLRQNDVVLELSAGLFDADRLVGFWLNGVRTLEGRRQAYDSGTAIVAAYRGRGLSTRLSELSTRLLVERGVSDQVLEVLTVNETAYRIYLRQGFRVRRRLACFRCDHPVFPRRDLPAEIRLAEGPFDPALAAALPAMEYEPSWQYATRSMRNIEEQVHAVLARRGQRIVGYGLVVRERGRIAQIGVDPPLWGGAVPSAILERLCRAVGSHGVALNNVDPAARRTVELLRAHGFALHVEQHEMIRRLAGPDRAARP